jgi:hypothetical protein
MENLTTNIGFCARCGKDHPNLEFVKFARSAGRDTHWAQCPETGEPILLSVSDTDAQGTIVQVPFEYDDRTFYAEIYISPVRRSNHIENGYVYIFRLSDNGVFENGQPVCKGNGWANFAVLFDVTRS